jgi:hypothetical protein
VIGVVIGVGVADADGVVEATAGRDMACVGGGMLPEATGVVLLVLFLLSSTRLRFLFPNGFAGLCRGFGACADHEDDDDACRGWRFTGYELVVAAEDARFILAIKTPSIVNKDIQRRLNRGVCT